MAHQVVTELHIKHKEENIMNTKLEMLKKEYDVAWADWDDDADEYDEDAAADVASDEAWVSAEAAADVAADKWQD